MCFLCWWFVNSISLNIHILGMQRNIHNPLPLKGFNKIIILLVELRRQMTSFLFFGHQILQIGMISCPFMIICKFLLVRVKWIPFIFAHDVVFWCFVFHFLFCNSLTILSQNCTIETMCALESMSSFWVLCFACLQMMSANISRCSQHYNKMWVQFTSPCSLDKYLIFSN
jgi:hypothetical protein